MRGIQILSWEPAQESLLRRRHRLTTLSITDSFSNKSKQLVTIVVALCSDEQEKWGSGEKTQK